MRIIDIEHWVLLLADQVSDGVRVEDDRVELKANWIAPEKAARRVAGQANARAGERILWVIGLDEVQGVGQPDSIEVSEWVAQVEGHFDGVAPAVQVTNVPVDGHILIALLFDTTRAPFVVRNPSFGQRPGDPVEWEVPWREGNATRTARRADLIRLLVPRTTAPQVEVFRASAGADRKEQADGGWDRGSGRPKEPHCWWDVHLSIYITPGTDERIVIPFHRSILEIEVPGVVDRAAVDEFRIFAPFTVTGRGPSRPASHTILASPTEVIIDGPGVLDVRAGRASQLHGLETDAELNWWLQMRTAADGTLIALEGRMGRVDTKNNRVTWRSPG